MRKTITIRELKAGGTVDDLFAVRFKKPVAAYKNGFTFQLWVSDSGGDLALKYWGERDEQKVKEVWETISKGSVIHVKGRVSEFKDSLEIHVNPSSGDLVNVLKEGEYELSDFVAVTDQDVEVMRSQLFSLIRKVENPWLKGLLANFFTDEGGVTKVTFASG